MQFDIERMLRLGGKKPTIRERWRAFYRLYRIARGIEEEHPLRSGVMDCLRVLGYGSFIASLDETEKQGRGNYPTFLRKMLLEADRRKRIYERIPWHQFSEMLDLNKQVANRLANENGVEMTPEEVAENQWSICRKIRAHAMEKGVFGLPESDYELLQWLKEGRE